MSAITCPSLGKQVVDFISKVIKRVETCDFIKRQSNGKTQTQLIGSAL